MHPGSASLQLQPIIGVAARDGHRPVCCCRGMTNGVPHGETTVSLFVTKRDTPAKA
jgi:hypothetical protein